jgi:hypothetical protein
MLIKARYAGANLRSGPALNRGLIHRGLYVLVFVSLCLFLWGASLVGQGVDTDGLRVTRSISTAYALPQSNFIVTLHLVTDQDLVGIDRKSDGGYSRRLSKLEDIGKLSTRS